MVETRITSVLIVHLDRVVLKLGIVVRRRVIVDIDVRARRVRVWLQVWMGRVVGRGGIRVLEVCLGSVVREVGGVGSRTLIVV